MTASMICTNHPETSEAIRRCAGCMNPFCDDCLVEMQMRPYCASCKQEQLLDVISGVDRTRLDLSSLWKRFAARVVDTLLFAVPFYAIFVALVVPRLVGSGASAPPPWLDFMGLPLALLWFLYEGAMLQARAQTLGKMAMQVRVVRADGSPITKGQAWGRALAQTLLSYLWFIDYIPAFFTKERTPLHDLIANTRVVDV
jgi:uncharacterized RDD family membrane protein YckC